MQNTVELGIFRRRSLVRIFRDFSAVHCLRWNTTHETDWQDKLTTLEETRSLARHRETTVGELVMGAARGAPLPPHPDQWLPRAERERHEDEVLIAPAAARFRRRSGEI